jgi:hypothetical protein
MKSSISATELEKVFMNDAFKSGDILKFNFSPLKTITTGKNGKQKEWLRKFLSHCDDSLERQALQQMLNP